MLWELTQLHPDRKTLRESSFDREGGNKDFFMLESGKSLILADLKGPAIIRHIWFSFHAKWRELLLKFTWDNAKFPSVCVPFGDFFGLGHGIVNSYQCFLFSTSTNNNNTFNQGCAFNSYLQMPFKERAVIEIINESAESIGVWFYIDYETIPLDIVKNCGYLHAEFHRENPFGGWGPEIQENSHETDGVMNLREDAWNNNYIILNTKGTGHYIGCNMSVTNLSAKTFESYGKSGYSWWGEGDDMIWIDGYKWPPELHGTGSEDYFNQGWGMQKNAFMRNGSSIHEFDTNGYSTSYNYHIENPIRFNKEIKVTIEIGQANHLGNDVSSVAYWYADKPTQIQMPPPVAKRMAIKRLNNQWIIDPSTQVTSRSVPLTTRMIEMKHSWARKNLVPYEKSIGTLSQDPNGQLIYNTSYMSSEVMQVPIDELLEDYYNKNILLNISGKFQSGKLTQKGSSVILNTSSLSEMLQTLIGKKLRIIFGKLLPDELKRYPTAEYLLEFSTDFNFRD